jgi:hypothetical protein
MGISIVSAASDHETLRLATLPCPHMTYRKINKMLAKKFP